MCTIYLYLPVSTDNKCIHIGLNLKSNLEWLCLGIGAHVSNLWSKSVLGKAWAQTRGSDHSSSVLIESELGSGLEWVDLGS